MCIWWKIKTGGFNNKVRQKSTNSCSPLILSGRVVWLRVMLYYAPTFSTRYKNIKCHDMNDIPSPFMSIGRTHQYPKISFKIPWTSCQIRNIADCACAGNAGNVFPRGRLQRKPLVSDPGMHHGTCVTHVPWCMSGPLRRGGGENVPDILGACASAVLRIW